MILQGETASEAMTTAFPRRIAGDDTLNGIIREISMSRRLNLSSALALCGVVLVAASACGKAPEAAAPEGQTEAEAAAGASVSDEAAMAADGQTVGADASQNGPDRGGPGMDAPMTLSGMQARSDERFDRMDADNDGVITTAELEARQADRPGGGRRGFGGGKMRADADGDGRINRAESRAAVAERFARMDANGDGMISEDERPQRGGGRPD